METITKESLDSTLAAFSGTEGWSRILGTDLFATDGVSYLLGAVPSAWDVVMKMHSMQAALLESCGQGAVDDMQFWTVFYREHPEGSGVLLCSDGNNVELLAESIPVCSPLLDGVRIWMGPASEVGVSGRVVLLPSEY